MQIGLSNQQLPDDHMLYDDIWWYRSLEVSSFKTWSHARKIGFFCWKDQKPGVFSEVWSFANGLLPSKFYFDTESLGSRNQGKQPWHSREILRAPKQEIVVLHCTVCYRPLFDECLPSWGSCFWYSYQIWWVYSPRLLIKIGKKKCVSSQGCWIPNFMSVFSNLLPILPKHPIFDIGIPCFKLVDSPPSSPHVLGHHHAIRATQRPVEPAVIPDWNPRRTIWLWLT